MSIEAAPQIQQCPTCHGSGVVGKPPWQQGNDNGYTPGRHCVILRNKYGRVSPCVNQGLCEYCPILHSQLDECDRQRAIQYDARAHSEVIP